MPSPRSSSTPSRAWRRCGTSTARSAACSATHDIELASLALRPATAGIVLVTEDRWAESLSVAARRAGGRILGGERIPASRVETVLTDRPTMPERSLTCAASARPAASGTDLLARPPCGARAYQDGARAWLVDSVEQLDELADLLHRGLLSRCGVRAPQGQDHRHLGRTRVVRSSGATLTSHAERVPHHRRCTNEPQSVLDGSLARRLARFALRPALGSAAPPVLGWCRPTRVTVIVRVTSYGAGSRPDVPATGSAVSSRHAPCGRRRERSSPKMSLLEPHELQVASPARAALDRRVLPSTAPRGGAALRRPRPRSASRTHGVTTYLPILIERAAVERLRLIVRRRTSPIRLVTPGGCLMSCRRHRRGTPPGRGGVVPSSPPLTCVAGWTSTRPSA